jgi:peptidylamidoglycolate lyase
MQRRKFLYDSSLLTTGVFAGFSSLKAQRPGPDIFGHQQKRYTVDLAWGNLDKTTHPVKDCHEMIQDRKGRIFLLTNETRNNILIYDRSGKLLDSWGHDFPGGHGLTCFDANGEESLFICDNNRHAIFKTTLQGKVLMTLAYPKEPGIYTKEEEFVPTETAIAPNGDIYVADGYGKDYIIQYSAEGKYIRHFGGRGSGPGHLLNAHGVCLDTRKPGTPTLLVTSRMQNAFKRFSLAGEYIETIPLPGAWVCRPVIKGQFLYVAVLQSEARQWQQSGFVLVLDQNNKVVSNIGGNLPAYNEGVPEEMYQTVKLFSYPHDVCVDDDENLYVAQWNSGQVYPCKLKPVVS